MKSRGMTQPRWFVRRDNVDWVRSFCPSRGSRSRILRRFRRPYCRAFVGRDSTGWLGPRSFINGGREWHFSAESKDKSHDGPISRTRRCCERLTTGLAPISSGLTTLDRVTRLDLTQPLHALLSWEQSRQLERWAPTHLTVPSGSNVRVEYDTPDLPILAVRLQEMFGCKDTPRLVDGKIPVMLHLLSPAKRPVQVTQDLSSFWANAYQDVRKELRGRYPKHSWPDDPLTAPPTAKVKRRIS